ncbi:(-)-germacrene D synthase-like [Telopea speciosissima]|uniref:(-)-germacrene D synthase-like n=1 Tax=Telopea speciosissima TaxID=54955 RepID=UPI001CC40183|nr:(-)-germacrene D synthase-like [Telopea speciosissima]
MFVQSSFAPSPNPNDHFVENANTKTIRRLADFHPSIWGDCFITNAPNDMNDHACLEQVEKLKEEVRRMVVADSNESLKKLNLIDSLQRLGVAYHFEGEIEDVLEKIHEAGNGGFDGNDDGELYTVALQFRLLRQQGYKVPCDVFNRFKDSDSKFKEDLINDVNGMLSLYEATHLGIHGEDILDEALEFTTKRLKSIVIDLKPPLAKQVMNALKQPFHKGLSRVEVRNYISVYQEDKKKNESLLQHAKLDFNLLQSIYQKELSQLSIWWKELDFVSKLPWARDRLVECYFWTVGEYFEPHYGFARNFFTKICLLTSIIDDVYDVYGTPEELQLFTDAIERWDSSPDNRLPEYMKLLYSSLLDVYNEAEDDLRKEGQSYRVNYAKEAMITLVKAYFMEAKWFNDGYHPTFEEYMEVASITGGCTHLTIVSFVGMGDIMTKEVFDWVMNEPKLVKASNLIARLMNDIVSHKFEQERGHVYSAVECYMEQYNIPELEVHDELNKKVEDAWKDINEACMKPMAFPMPLLLRCVNLARITDVTYKYKDGYTLSHEVLKEFITSLFIDPIRM